MTQIDVSNALSARLLLTPQSWSHINDRSLLAVYRLGDYVLL